MLGTIDKDPAYRSLAVRPLLARKMAKVDIGGASCEMT